MDSPGSTIPYKVEPHASSSSSSRMVSSEIKARIGLEDALRFTDPVPTLVNLTT
jgi:hypothetical protein